MPAPVPLPLRQAIWRRFQLDQSVHQIASDLGLSPRTVRHLIQRFHSDGKADLRTTYAVGPLPPTDPKVHAALLELRHLHPNWGAELIRIVLQREQPDLDLPDTRTLQRWLKHAGLAPAPRGRRHTGPARGRAEHPHDVWQIDAAEKMPLKSGDRVSWLRIVDECSGGVLRTVVFPPRQLVASAS